jgi:hypothetical protein
MRRKGKVNRPNSAIEKKHTIIVDYTGILLRKLSFKASSTPDKETVNALIFISIP